MTGQRVIAGDRVKQDGAVMTGRARAVVHVHRWGHGLRSPRPPDALLTESERLGIERPPSWPTPLQCRDCGVLWPGEPLPCPNEGRES
jgi:hypothetical protein